MSLTTPSLHLVAFQFEVAADLASVSVATRAGGKTERSVLVSGVLLLCWRSCHARHKSHAHRWRRRLSLDRHWPGPAPARQAQNFAEGASRPRTHPSAG